LSGAPEETPEGRELKVKLVSIRRAKLFDKMYGKQHPIKNLQYIKKSTGKWRLLIAIILLSLCVGGIFRCSSDNKRVSLSKEEISNLSPKAETADPYRDELIESIIIKANQYGNFKYGIDCGKRSLCEKEIKFSGKIDPHGEMHFFMNETEYRVDLKKIAEVFIRSDTSYRVLTFVCKDYSCIYRDRNGIRFNAVPWSQLVDIPIDLKISFFEVEQLRNNYMNLIEYYKNKN